MLDVEQVMLAETFQQLLEQEQQAEKLYCELSSQVSDLNAKQQVQQIHREKLRHVQLVERLLEIVD